MVTIIRESEMCDNSHEHHSGVALLQDLYVMRRAVGVYERLIRRFTAQDTDYQLLLSTFAEGLYTEMDFRNEALNMERMTMLMEEAEFGSRDVIIPKPVMGRTTRSASLTHSLIHTHPNSSELFQLQHYMDMIGDTQLTHRCARLLHRTVGSANLHCDASLCSHLCWQDRIAGFAHHTPL